MVGEDDPGVDLEGVGLTGCRMVVGREAMWPTRRAERRLRRFMVKKVVPPGTRLRRWLVVGWEGVGIPILGLLVGGRCVAGFGEKELAAVREKVRALGV